MSDGVTITCTCGHEASLGEFTRTPLAGELPAGSYQCPACSVAWHVEKTPIRVARWTDRQGREQTSLISEPNKIVTENSYL